MTYLFRMYNQKLGLDMREPGCIYCTVISFTMLNINKPTKSGLIIEKYKSLK